MSIDFRTELIALLSTAGVRVRDVSQRTGISATQIGRALRGQSDALSIDQLYSVKKTLQDQIRTGVVERPDAARGRA